MADLYNRADEPVTTSAGGSYITEVTTGVAEAWLLNITVYNITSGSDCTFKAWLEDSTNALIMQLTAEYSPLPAGAAELIIDRPIGMVPGDIIKVQASANSVCRCSAFILETT